MPILFQLSRVVLLFFLFAASCLHAQTRQIEVSATYIADRSLKANTTQDFWMQGGSVELGVNLWRGLGVAADVTGTHAGSIGSSGVPLSLVTTTFGPRYRWHPEGKISLYGQGLVGEANGFGGLFPTPTGGQGDANSIALQIGGGMDYRLSGRFAVRALNAAWVRTQFPNATDNVQNNLRLGAGVVVRFGSGR